MLKRTVLSTLLMLSMAGSAWAGQREDLPVFNDVSRQVQRYPYYSVFDSVAAGVDDGVVVLSGKVTMGYKATEIAKRVAKVDGVRQVVNKIEVLPVSFFDDELRAGLARAIFTHPALANYALGPNPSIHIVVERGRVTLDGVVNNDSDRIIANSIARSFSTFGVTNELKTDDEVERELERL